MLNNSHSSYRGYHWIFVAVLLIVAVNLRPSMAALGPLLDLIQHDTGLTSSSAGLLTTLPVLAMGLCALTGAMLHRRFGAYHGVTLGLAMIGAACGARWWLNETNGLIVTAALGGAGIAFVQALLPGYIRDQFPNRVGLLMGLYTTGIMGGAAIAAMTASPIADATSWNGALALWSLPTLVAGLAWVMIAQSAPQPNTPSAMRLPLRSPRAWLLTLFFGLGTSAYTLVLAWLPPFYMELGWNASQSGLLLGVLTIAEVIAGLCLSVMITRFTDRRPLLYGVLIVLLAGLATLLIAPTTLAIAAAVLLGIGIGTLFPLSLIITMDHTHDARSASAWMALVQGGGYMIASLMPLLAGMLRDSLSSLSMAWMVMAGGVVVLIVLTGRLSPASMS
ncbi:MFS transporter [Halomonas sp. HMF6819]|uniref:MFS transporter n=1 Tax=Halomonas sp. HMF6819 TaxID=3373085 RepID=UPI003795107A